MDYVLHASCMGWCAEHVATTVRFYPSAIYNNNNTARQMLKFPRHHFVVDVLNYVDWSSPSNSYDSVRCCRDGKLKACHWLELCESLSQTARICEKISRIWNSFRLIRFIVSSGNGQFWKGKCLFWVIWLVCLVSEPGLLWATEWFVRS